MMSCLVEHFYPCLSCADAYNFVLIVKTGTTLCKASTFSSRPVLLPCHQHLFSLAVKCSTAGSSGSTPQQLFKLEVLRSAVLSMCSHVGVALRAQCMTDADQAKAEV